MTTRVKLSKVGEIELEGEIAEPSASGKAPAIVLIQEWWGVNDHIRSLVDRFAKEGFLTLAPDLYHSMVAKTQDKAAQAMGGLDWPQALQEIGASVAYLKEHPRSSGKVGVVGFCMGGALTFAAACRVPGISAAVPFYGIPSDDVADYSKITAAVQGHFARHDEWAKASMAEAIKKKLEAEGKTMELHVYDANHAFMNDTRPEVFDAANAKTAWSRAVAFFHKHLA